MIPNQFSLGNMRECRYSASDVAKQMKDEKYVMSNFTDGYFLQYHNGTEMQQSTFSNFHNFISGVIAFPVVFFFFKKFLLSRTKTLTRN